MLSRVRSWWTQLLPQTCARGQALGAQGRPRGRGLSRPRGRQPQPRGLGRSGLALGSPQAWRPGTAGQGQRYLSLGAGGTSTAARPASFRAIRWRGRRRRRGECRGSGPRPEHTGYAGAAPPHGAGAGPGSAGIPWRWSGEEAALTWPPSRNRRGLAKPAGPRVPPYPPLTRRPAGREGRRSPRPAVGQAAAIRPRDQSHTRRPAIAKAPGTRGPRPSLAPRGEPPARPRSVRAVFALCRVVPAKVRDRVVDQGLQSSLPSGEVARGLPPISGPGKADPRPAALLAARERGQAGPRPLLPWAPLLPPQGSGRFPSALPSFSPPASPQLFPLGV